MYVNTGKRSILFTRVFEDSNIEEVPIFTIGDGASVEVHL